MKKPLDRYLPVIRELARCYQAFEQVSGRHVRHLGLTPPQFDIIVTLGNTPGMSCKELGEKTLITKGTLTGVLDRLEERGLIGRAILPSDRRSIFIRLTPEGDALFQRIFPEHVAYMRPIFNDFADSELQTIRQGLEALRLALSKKESAPS